METHQITSYNFNELDDEAKDKAIQHVRDNWHDLYMWHDDNVGSLKAFCDYFDLSSMDYSISFCGYSYASAKVHDDISELSGVRLWKYLNRHYIKNDVLDGNCPFTGYCLDESLLDSIRSFMAKPDDSDFQELIDDCLAGWVKDYITDWEYTYSDESISELLEINDYQFLDDGELYN